MITTLVFDIGGVLIDWNPRYMYRKFVRNDEKLEWFLHDVCNLEWNLKQDGGRPVDEATAEKVSEYPTYRDWIEPYYGRWREELGGPILPTVELIRNVKREGKYRLLALTNWSEVMFTMTRNMPEYSFLDEIFEGILVSGVEKMVKPSPEIYNLLLSRYGAKAEECVFIDDSPRNVEGARRVGMNAVLFGKPSELASQLAELGVTI